MWLTDGGEEVIVGGGGGGQAEERGDQEPPSDHRLLLHGVEEVVVVVGCTANWQDGLEERARGGERQQDKVTRRKMEDIIIATREKECRGTGTHTSQVLCDYTAADALLYI